MLPPLQSMAGRSTYATLTRVLGIRERTNSLSLDPGLEHSVLSLTSRASLDEIYNPICLMPSSILVVRMTLYLECMVRSLLKLVL